jgi:hypothetical protein
MTNQVEPSHLLEHRLNQRHFVVKYKVAIGGARWTLSIAVQVNGQHAK